jgi:hypothetical protein
MVRKRSSAQQILAGATVKPQGNSYPKWSDMMVNLSVKEQKRVTRKLKLVGDPYEFTEYVDKQYVPNPTNDPALKGKTVRVPFPDADVKKSFTRIGNDDDPANCPWKKLGYISTTQYAQNCFEKQDDGTWVVKILKKGKSIFRDIAKEQINRYNDPELDDDDPKHFGVRTSPCVRITAEATGYEGPKSVEYSVGFDPKSTYITDEMIEMLRKVGEPSAEDLAEERQNYNKDRKSDPSMPEWEDFYLYGYPLHKIFKHTPIAGTEIETAKASAKHVEEDIEPDVKGYHVSPPKSAPVEEVAEKKPVKKPTPPPPPVEDEDDEDSLGWMNEED